MANSFFGGSGLAGTQWAVFGPIDHEFALAEKPGAVVFDERVEVAAAA
jgi:hypothetical protein